MPVVQRRIADRCIECGLCKKLASANEMHVITHCGHYYHIECIQKLNTSADFRCPVCTASSNAAKKYPACPTQGLVEKEHSIRIVLCGDTGVGKSALLEVYDKGEFATCVSSTAGIYMRRISVNIDGKPIKLNIWDIPGQHRYLDITPNYFRNANGVFLVYDVTKPDSLQDLDKWLEVSKKSGGEKMSFILVGNKTDLTNQRGVPTAEGEKIARQLNLHFMETSAKDSVNVKAAFDFLAVSIYERGLRDNHEAKVILKYKALEPELSSCPC